MLKHVWTIIAERAIVDQQKSTVSLMDVLEEITFTADKGQTPPAEGSVMLLPFHHEVVSQWVKAEGEEQSFILHLAFVDPHGKQLGEIKNTTVFPPGSKNARTILRMDQIPVTIAGSYYFNVSISDPEESKKTLVAQIPIQIKLLFDKVKPNGNLDTHRT